MDPYFNSLAYKMLDEMLSELEPDDAHHLKWGRHLLHGLGGLLVALGQKLQAGGLEVQAAFEDTAYPALDDELCA